MPKPRRLRGRLKLLWGRHRPPGESKFRLMYQYQYYNLRRTPCTASEDGFLPEICMVLDGNIDTISAYLLLPSYPDRSYFAKPANKSCISRRTSYTWCVVASQTEMQIVRQKSWTPVSPSSSLLLDFLTASSPETNCASWSSKYRSSASCASIE